ncbi:MAG: 30S ribosomal protein S20 [Oligoflexales bacterium]|nr:30S ribosomal protein S20 [Oligoflexales bacterium]
MAHHKSAQKRIRSNKRKNVRNKQYLSSVRTQIKKFRTVLGEFNKTGKGADLVQAELVKAQSLLGKACAKGMMHKNTARRYTGRLALSVAKNSK